MTATDPNTRELIALEDELGFGVGPEGYPEAFVASRSRPGYTYRMIRLPVSGWVHADDDCPGNRARGVCQHRKDLEMSESNEEARAEAVGALVPVTQLQVAPGAHPVLLVEYDAGAISRGVSPEVAAKWAYDLPSSEGRGARARGVGVRGAEEGTRLLAMHGEIIRVDCDLEDGEREAYFRAVATRYVVLPDGSEKELDRIVRGKRQPKYGRRRDSQQEYFIDAWYEIGFSKATRNAALALMPANVKSAILQAGLDAATEEHKGRAQGGEPRQGGRVAQPERREEVTDAEKRLRQLLGQLKDQDAAGFDAFITSAKGPYSYAFDRNGRFLITGKLTAEDVATLTTDLEARIKGETPPAGESTTPVTNTPAAAPEPEAAPSDAQATQPGLEAPAGEEPPEYEDPGE